jgi:hypothetical protein
MDSIEPKSFMLHISEYGETVRQYNDKEHERFLKVSKEIIAEHLLRSMAQNGNEVKNVKFHIYTY